MSEASDQLGRILVDRSILTEAELALHLTTADTQGRALANVLAESLPDGRATVLKVAAERLGIPYYDPAEGPEPDAAALRAIDKDLAVAHVALPVAIAASYPQLCWWSLILY